MFAELRDLFAQERDLRGLPERQIAALRRARDAGASYFEVAQELAPVLGLHSLTSIGKLAATLRKRMSRGVTPGHGTHWHALHDRVDHSDAEEAHMGKIITETTTTKTTEYLDDEVD